MGAFSKSENFKSEYSCAIVRIGELIPVADSDNLVKTNIFGTQIVVNKTAIREGDLMLYAANETQLNQDFLSVNNQFEMGSRELNSNVEEINTVLQPYLDVQPQIDEMKGKAKGIKSTVDSITKTCSKLQKDIKKLTKKLESYDPNSEDYAKLRSNIEEKQAKYDEKYKVALEKSVRHTNLKAEIKSKIDEYQPIIDEANKMCGYFSRTCRVRCIVLRKEPSFGCLFNIESIQKFDPSITEDDVKNYEGEEFDTINGVLFCKAYIPPVTVRNTKNGGNTKGQKRVSRFDRMVDGEFYLHYETDQLGKNMWRITPNTIVTCSLKAHGTSAVFGKVQVKEPIKLPFIKRYFNKFVDATGLFKGHRVTDYELVYGPVYSSRKVIKNQYINSEVSGGYYGADVWTEWGDIIYPYLEEGMTVYGEIVGYITGSEKPIQKLYDYGCEVGQNKFMPYRITTTHNGEKYEWNVTDVQDWTKYLMKRMEINQDENAKRIMPIDILYHGTLENLYPEIDTETHWHETVLEAMKKDKKRFGMEDYEPLCTHSKVPREGIVLRIFNDPLKEAFKLKCSAFLTAEALEYDAGNVDIEAADNYAEDNESENP